MARVELICVGTELLLDRVNTDVNIVSAFLRARGLTLARNVLVPDEMAEMTAALRDSLDRSDLVLVTGGLGPTFDDVTREAAAEVLGRKIEFSAAVWQPIEERLLKRVKVIPEINKRQAQVLEGSRVLPNTVGTAPGLALTHGAKRLILLPGPPYELSEMLDTAVDSYLKEEGLSGPEREVYRFVCAGLPESVVEERTRRIRDEYGKKGALTFTILTRPMLIDTLVQVPRAEDRCYIKEIEELFRVEFGDDFIGLNPPAPPELIGQLLIKAGLTLALAESCTGGLAGNIFTDTPGSSRYFQGSFVAYHNVLKRRILKVSRALLHKHGAVSEEVAVAMARGARKAGKADVGLSFTGIAGPDGGTDAKPVGLVWVAAALPKNRLVARRLNLPGKRAQVRERAVYAGLDLLRRELTKIGTK